MKRMVFDPKHRRSLHGVGLLLTLAALLFAGHTLVSARTNDGYDLSWWTVDGGGGALGTGDGYALSGTAGQWDAHVLADGGSVLAGGFWGGGAPPIGTEQHPIYLPLVLRNR